MGKVAQLVGRGTTVKSCSEDGQRLRHGCKIGRTDGGGRREEWMGAHTAEEL